MNATLSYTQDPPFDDSRRKVIQAEAQEEQEEEDIAERVSGL